MEPGEKVKNQIIDQLTREGNSGLEINTWTKQSTENRSTFSKVNKIWKAVDFISSMNRFGSADAWRKVDQSIRQQTIRKLRIQKLGYAISGMAASMIIILGLAFYTGLFTANSNKLELATEYGSRSKLTLPDGSIVTLNSGSKIDYHYNKTKGMREVAFSGEAFFKVAKSRKPFVIHTSKGMDLKVLGTSFNLSAYPEDLLIETTLIEGKVELSSPTGEKLILSPGKIGSYNKSSKILTYQNGIPSHETGWLNSKIYLDNTSLLSLARNLERRFDVNITMDPVSIGEEIHYTGVLEESNIVDILKALSDLSEIKYKINGKKIQIMTK